jgi:cell division protein FtsZ
VHQINEIIHDAVGDDAEIIFGAVHEPAMQGEIRVTVIATGFDRVMNIGTTPASHQEAVSPIVAPKGSPVIPFPNNRPTRVGGTQLRGPVENPRPPRQAPEKSAQDLSDMEIPTFIRRQMD